VSGRGAEQAVVELGVEAEVVKVDNPGQMAVRWVMMPQRVGHGR